ncbi:protein turtle homolog B-like isoform X2 [Venturia canescens]|uniref:protein turtle homolog B-like isoform X2 n=1 Tax=Venturia canescens TaxID=32260 RepID=UPI001C9C1A20|nr:protein turtle homolog B-like isoform X2 [Venturia canescens]
MCTNRKNAGIGASFSKTAKLALLDGPLLPRRIILTLALCFGTFVQRNHAIITNQEIVRMTDADAVAGGIAQLPCDVEPPVPGEKLQLVIWYKEGTDTPIYSFDSRETGSLEQGMHWQDPNLNGRGSFSHADKPASLRLESVRESDAGLYRCRVDFRQSPTRNSKVNLTVIIPPDQLSILDEDGRSHIRNYILGPYSEGSSLNITCVATGGRPQPRVTWWQENALLDDSYDTVGVKSVRNVLRLEKLERKHLHAVFTCQASNNNMVAPISSSVSLNMTLKPLWVRILGENRALSAGATYELSCEVVGARPVPEIIWTKGSMLLRNARQTSEQDGNVTTSTVTFVPSIEDAGKFVTCRGGVSEIPGSALEDSWKLDIHHQPVVSLELGSNLNASAIREGMDVYFECNIRSNPWVYKVFWQHNGNPLYNNAATGTIVSNQSLVLQSVSRQSAGRYTCIGSNQEGDGRSNDLNLDIKYAPVCHQGQTRVFGVARQEPVTIPCELEANPPRVSFTWKFNNTMEAVDIAQEHISTEGTRSKAAYTPMTELDYGTLLCWGTNDQGTQVEPCVYHIVPAGRPDTPQNCTILNQTTNSLYVECTEGFDGGLPQRFTLELEMDDSTNTLEARGLVHNRTSKEASFGVHGLTPGSTYHATIYASNAKGRSEAVRLRAATLNLPERRTGESRLAHPPSPENCTIKEESRTSVRVSCAESEYLDSNSATYVLQVFDAGTRHLLASATSLTPSMLEVTDLPPERSRSGLVLFLRIMTAHAMSNATVLQSQRFLQEQGKSPEHRRYPALTPVILSLSGPLLGAIVAAAAGLLLVVFVIVLAVRLRYRPRNREDKDSHDDGGMSDLAAPIDKSGSSLPPSSASAESFDEKDPDIIPHANENAYTELSMGTLPRYVLQQKPQVSQQRPETTSFGTSVKNIELQQLQQGAELTYAELTLGCNRRVPPNCYEPVQISSVHRPQLLPMSTLGKRRPNPTTIHHLRHETPTVYAQVANLPSKAIYVTPPPPHPYRGSHSSTNTDDATAETPLIGCDYKIPTIAESTSTLSWRTENPVTSTTSTT